MLKQQFGQCNIANIFFDRSTYLVAKDCVKQKIKQNIHDEYIMKRHNELKRNLSRSGLGGNKLRTYRTFKLRHTYPVFYPGDIEARMRNSGVVWRRQGLKQDIMRNFQLSRELLFIVRRVSKQRNMCY